MTVAENLAAVEARIAAACLRAGRPRQSVTLVAVSKTHPPELVRQAHAAGARVFGENYVQELRGKQAELAALPDVVWHLVGRLQKNKAKDVVGQVALIHSVDSIELAEIISRRAPEKLVQDILVEVNVAGEDTKAGIIPDALPPLLEKIARLKAVRCRGLMTMPPPPADPEDNRPHFAALAGLAKRYGLLELSMGMTGDFEVAIEEGATLVRIGTAIFGER